jgi:hypothetical protein
MAEAHTAYAAHPIIAAALAEFCATGVPKEVLPSLVNIQGFVF